MSEWLPIKEAAEWLGISPDTIRRRLKRGELTGRQEPTAQGYVWQIEVPADLGATQSQTEQALPAQGLGDVHELVQLRERVAGLERLTTELAENRNAWREQAARSEESARELRILVQLLASVIGSPHLASANTHQRGRPGPIGPGLPRCL